MLVKKPGLARSFKPFRRPWLQWVGLWALGIAAVVVASLLPAPDLPNLHVSDKASTSAPMRYRRRRGAVVCAAPVVVRGLHRAGAARHRPGVRAGGVLTTTRTMDAADALANSLGVLARLATSLTPWRDALLRHEPGR